MRLDSLHPDRARTLVAAFRGLPVLVVGDVMLDRFITGSVDRISPEAPVPVVRFRSERATSGGAANVARNLASLGARVSLVGVVGADQAADRVRGDLLEHRIPVDALIGDPSRRTTEKVRIVTDRHQQVARVDYEEQCDLDPATERRVLEHVDRLAAGASAVVASDYLKGTMTAAVMRLLVARVSAARPLLVDPKIPHLDNYSGATVLTPNQPEAEAATHRQIRSEEDVAAAAAAFRSRARCRAVLLTRGELGMYLSSDQAEGAIPATAREVADVTGAGDTVIATLALGLSAGATLAEAAWLANQAAGIVVGRFGPATASPEELIEAFARPA
jgi:D-beta-D-heptose 7-phosphate kinase/D-beta-D-heptose 1-phosphate adenosyltransferase